MKKGLLTSFIFVVLGISTYPQCTAKYVYNSNFEVISFTNQSSIDNAHYWWNFGDGTGSYYEHPIHTYTDNGDYLVTLFGYDTINLCNSYYEKWISVVKDINTNCQPAMYDTIFVDNGETYLQIFDLSSNCQNLITKIDGLGFCNFGPGASVGIGVNPKARFTCRIKYYESIGQDLEIVREAYSSSVVGYSSSNNYSDCSANFEFILANKDENGQRIFFRAMNRNAISYKWIITGFGVPIYHYTDTMSHYFPYTFNDLSSVYLITEGESRCIDTLCQNILRRKNITTILGTPLIENAEHYIQFSPNPFTSETSILFPNESNELFYLDLYDISGRNIYRMATKASQFKIYNSDIPRGIYIFRLSNPHTQITGKLIKLL